MNVEVLLFGSLREVAIRHQIVSLKDGSRVDDLMEWLVREYGPGFRKELNQIKNLNILINGQLSSLSDKREMPLKGGDIVAILPIITGG